MKERALPFILVGLFGFAIQLSVLTALTLEWQWPLGTATALAVEAAVLTNFLWHERWTWRDRRCEGHERFARLLRFHASSGFGSIAGNVAITLVLVQVGAAPWFANTIAVAVLSIANFLAADRWVFARQTIGIAAILLAVPAAPAAAADLRPETIAAWNGYVAEAERSGRAYARPEPAGEPRGEQFAIPGGNIHEWRGSIIVPGVTVRELVDILQDADAFPLQDDVAESRVLARQGDSLRVYLKLVRRFLVTVTYDTEHDVTYVRASPTLATSRSVATRIVETGGTDRGFLWRLNSYWRYQQEGTGVRVDVLSLSLSRDVPSLVRPIADPLIARIGRESMVQTLAMVQRASAAAERRRRVSAH